MDNLFFDSEDDIDSRTRRTENLDTNVDEMHLFLSDFENKSNSATSETESLHLRLEEAEGLF